MNARLWIAGVADESGEGFTGGAVGEGFTEGIHKRLSFGLGLIIAELGRLSGVR